MADLPGLALALLLRGSGTVFGSDTAAGTSTDGSGAGGFWVGEAKNSAREVTLCA
jgi:hypothetical protein